MAAGRRLLFGLVLLLAFARALGVGFGCREVEHETPPIEGEARADGGRPRDAEVVVDAKSSADAPGASPLPFVFPGASFSPGTLCEADGWCWISPRPSGAWWRGVGGAGPADFWIGGMTQTLLHLDGGHWSAVTSPLSDTEAIWASSAHDVWFAGSTRTGVGAIAHWDGRAVTLATEIGMGQLLGLWGSGPHDVYAVGFGPAQHWDGRAWTPLQGVVGETISGSGPDDIWVGASNGLLHFDGLSWSRIPELEGRFIQGVAVRAVDDVWVAVLHDGVQDIQHFDGRAWSVSVQLPAANNLSVRGIGVGSNHEIWVVGTQTVPPRQQLRGYLLRFDGASWTEGPIAPTPLDAVRAVPGAGTIAVGQNGGLLLLTGGSQFVDLRSGPAENLTGVWASSPTDVWAVGEGGTVLHFDGRAVAKMPVDAGLDLEDVWGTAPDDVWLVGRSGIALHFDGTGFRSVPTGVTADLHAVFAAAANDVWMGGENATLLHFDGLAFEPITLAGLDGPAAVRDIHGRASGDVWLSGGGSEIAGGGFQAGFVAHFDGTAWSGARTLNAASGGFPARRVWALAPNDVWVLTQPVFRGLVQYHHFDGATWTERFMLPSAETFMFPKPGDASALGSFVLAPDDLWIVGTLGAWQRHVR